MSTNPITIEQWDSYYGTAPDVTVEQLQSAMMSMYGWTADYCVLIIGTTINEGYPLDPYLLYAWCSAMIGKRNSSAASYQEGFATDQGAWNIIAGWDPNGNFYSRENVYAGFNSGGYVEARKSIYLAMYNTNTNVFSCYGPNPPAGTYFYYASPVYCPPYHDQIGVAYIIGRPIDAGFDVYSDTGKPTKLSEFRAKIFHALACPTGYWVGMGSENYGFWNGSLFWFDCVNLIKAILAGWYDSRVYGTRVTYANILSLAPGEPEMNEGGLIAHCQNVSTDFTQLNLTSVLFWDDRVGNVPPSGHIGCYVGDYIRDGKTYNTIECTSGDLGEGVVSSYVTSTGLRKPHKDAAYGDIVWNKHGLLTTWLTYDVGNVDPGGSIVPVNPGGGGVEPPGYERPPIYGLGKRMKPFMYVRRRI